LRLRPQEGDPHVRDDAGPLFVQQHVGLAGRHAEVVPIAGLVQIPARIGLGVQFLLSSAAAHLADAHRGSGSHRPALVRLGESLQGTAGRGRNDAREDEQHSPDRRHRTCFPSGFHRDLAALGMIDTSMDSSTATHSRPSCQTARQKPVQSVRHLSAMRTRPPDFQQIQGGQQIGIVDVQEGCSLSRWGLSLVLHFSGEDDEIFDGHRRPGES
jgi:hypothetical protein